MPVGVGLVDGVQVSKPSTTSKPSSRPRNRNRIRATPSQPRKSAPSSVGSSAPPPKSPPSTPRQSGEVETTTPTKPKPPSIKNFLAGDDVYQQAVRGGQRTLSDFLSELTRRRGEAKSNFGQTQETLELDRQRQLDRMKDEFASRGLIHSGLFAKEQGRFQEDFQTQMDLLEQAQSQLINDLISQERNFKREQELAMEAARQEALSRRAARFEIPA